jgi:hypothetical protein
MNKASMCYDTEQDQWFVRIRDRWYGLRCGESFEIYIDKQAFPCRLELDAYSWYVILEESSFALRPRSVYSIII